jgi:hypothetical protein
MSGEITSAVFALLGATLGSLTTIVVQWRASALERRKLTHDARGRVNALAIAVFRELLASTKVVERLAERREAGEALADDDIRDATDRMWLKWQEVSVFCPAAIHEPSLTFVRALQHVVWQRTAESATTYLLHPRGELFHVAGPIFRELDTLGYAEAGGSRPSRSNRPVTAV